MFSLFASIFSVKLWFALPLVIVVSLVYAATRHEAMKPILAHALRTAIWIFGFMSIIFAIVFSITVSL